MKILKIIFDSVYKNPKDALVILKILVGTAFSFIAGVIFWGCADGYKACKIKAERKINDISSYWKGNGRTDS